MAITIDGVEYRNLQEQVQKNKEDIARHYEIDRVIADFGIRVLGAVPTVADIPEGQYTYGDAYLVTNENTTYIWTRANPLIGQDVPYWLDVGNLSIPGPEGPQGATGPQGPQGPRGSLWYIGTTTPVTTDARINDMYLNASTGNVYKFNGASWVIYQSIKGPQGPQGPQGPRGVAGPQGPQGPQGAKGDTGGFINIAGIVANTNQLPNPSLLADLTKAYLVGASAPYNIYIQVGDNSQTANWYNMGAFNVATLINLNGSNENFINLTDSPTIIWDQNDLGDTTANLSASIINDVTRSIKAPMSNPSVKSVPVINPNGAITYEVYGGGSGASWVEVPYNQNAEQSEEDGMFNVWGWKVESSQYLRFFGTTEWNKYLISISIPCKDGNGHYACIGATFILNDYEAPRGVVPLGNIMVTPSLGYWQVYYPASPDAFGMSLGNIDMGNMPEELLNGARVYALKIIE